MNAEDAATTNLETEIEETVLFTSLLAGTCGVELVEARGRPGDVEGSEGVDSVRDDGEPMDWKQYLWVLCIRVVSRPG